MSTRGTMTIKSDADNDVLIFNILDGSLPEKMPSLANEEKISLWKSGEKQLKAQTNANASAITPLDLYRTENNVISIS